MLRKIWTAFMLSLCMALWCSAAVSAEERDARWQKSQDGKYWMYDDGSGLVKNKTIEIERKLYGFDTAGRMRTGYAKISGNEYYFSSAGVKDPTKGSYGSAVKNKWEKIDKLKFAYFGSDGLRDKYKTGFQSIGGNIYYLGNSGKASTGAKTIRKRKFYFKSNGVMVTGPKKIDGKIYLYSASGAVGQKGARVTARGWQKADGKYYYVSNSKGQLKTGWTKVGGSRYYLSKKTGERAVGWQYVGKYKYYFGKNGKLKQDVSSVLGRQGSYYITVNRKTCVVTIYAKDGKKGYTIPVKAMTCSVGKSGSNTPTGTFRTKAKYRWKVLMGPTWGQYSTRITGSILFHSVAGYNRTSYNLKASDYNMLGRPASHGCVRLCVRDAKWIYDNCKIGTTVTITDRCAQPFDKPKTIKIRASQHYDPTDPNVKKR